MKRTTAPGSVAGLHVDRVAGVTAGSRGIAEDRNNLQEEVCHPIVDAGFSLDGADDYQLERAIIAFRKRIGEYDFQAAEITPITIAASRSKANPSYPEYYPCIPRYDANHDVTTTEVPQDVVDVFRAIKGKYKNTQDFTVTVSGSNVTFPATAASAAALTALQNDALVAGFLNNAQAASFVADFATNATKQTITIAGTEYVVSSINVGSYLAVVSGTPATGSQTASIYPHRIAGSTTSFRLPRLGGFVPAAANDDDGLYSAGKRVMDRLMNHWHTAGFFSNTAGNMFSSGASQQTAGAFTQTGGDPVRDVKTDTVNTLRFGKTTDPRAFGAFIGTWVRNLLATSWTSA